MSKNKINNNSRFSSLLKEKTVSPNNNNNNNNNNVPPSIQQRQPVINKYSKSKKEVMREELHKNKLKKEKQDLAPESFPVLASPTKNNQAAEVIIKSSFMEKLNSVIVVENKDDELRFTWKFTVCLACPVKSWEAVSTLVWCSLDESRLVLSCLV